VQVLPFKPPEEAEKLKAEFRAALEDYVENGSGIEKRRVYNE
jgi:hypothetical protein